MMYAVCFQVRVLGMGSYGLVILAMRQPDSVPVAIKFMTRGEKVRLLSVVRDSTRDGME